MTFSFFLFSILFVFTLSDKNEQNSFSDISIPPPTTPTGTAPYPSERPPTQSWPTEPIPWPPTMSPYPTKAPHTIPSKHKLSTGAIIGICIACIAVIALITVITIYCIRKKSEHLSLGLNDSMLLSEKNE